MILNEFVEISTNNRNYKKFIGLGYRFKVGDIISVKVCELSKSSRVIVDVKCDVCGHEKKLKYGIYIKNTSKYNLYTCCVKCSNVKYVKTCLENFGCKYPLQNLNIKNNLKSYFKEKYGVNHPSMLKEFELKKQDTNINRYGVKHQMFILKNISKIKKSKFDIYGNENYNNHKKCIETCIEKYGVENPMQFYDICRKQRISSSKSLLDINSNLYYQSKYELDFIKYCLINNIKIEEGLVISYKIGDKNRKYYSDFYLPKYNLICEVKSSYTMNYDYDENLVKKEYSINSGYNFLFIIDKDYKELEKIIN